MLFVFEGLEMNWKCFVSFWPFAANGFENLKPQLQIFCSQRLKQFRTFWALMTGRSKWEDFFLFFSPKLKGLFYTVKAVLSFYTLKLICLSGTKKRCLSVPEEVVSSVLSHSHQRRGHISLSLLSKYDVTDLSSPQLAVMPVFTSCTVRYLNALRLYLDPWLWRENWIQFQLQVALV